MYCTFPVMLSNDEELLLDESLLNLFLDPREIVVSSEKCQSSSKPNLEFSIKLSESSSTKKSVLTDAPNLLFRIPKPNDVVVTSSLLKPMESAPSNCP